MKYIPTSLGRSLLLSVMLFTGITNVMADTNVMRRNLPNAIDVMEYGLMWMQEYTGPENIHDPASLISAMEDRLARYFDFGRIALAVAGPDYWQLDMLERSHFQNRVRDRLFSELARQYGFYNFRPPQFQGVLPVKTGFNTWMVGNRVRHPNGRMLSIYFHLHVTPSGGRVYDVTINGDAATRYLRHVYLNSKL